MNDGPLKAPTTNRLKIPFRLLKTMSKWICRAIKRKGAPDQVDLLIDILFDDIAREDERDDAAMDLRQFNDDRALNALIQIASNPQEDWLILDSCGESIGEILVQRKELKNGVLEKLVPAAKDVTIAYIRCRKPEWLK